MPCHVQSCSKVRSIFFVLYLSAYLFSLTAELERTQALLWPAFARADFPLARDILGRTALLMGEVVVLRTAEHLLESAVSLFFCLEHQWLTCVV